MNNLVRTPGSAELQKELDALLNRKLTEAHDQFLPAQNYIRQRGYTVDADGTVPYEP